MTSELNQTYIHCDEDLCVGCNICELACSEIKEHTFNPLLSRIRVARIEPDFTTSMACRACGDPACVKACPRPGSLVPDDRTGLVRVDTGICDGCGWCIPACPFGVIAMIPSTKRVAICDLCDGEDEPNCVKYCPKDALFVATAETIAQRSRARVGVWLMRKYEEGDRR